MPTITSPSSTSASATVTADRWWLKNPTDATQNMELPVEGGGVALTFGSTERRGTFPGLGQAHPIVVADTVSGETIQLPLIFTTENEYTSYETLRASQDVLLLQSDHDGLHWYVRLGTARSAQLMTYGNRTTSPVRRVTLDAVEQAAP